MRHVDGAPIGTRGGLSVIYNFPLDAEYVFKMTFYYSVDGPLYGKSQGKTQQIEVSINGARVACWTSIRTAPNGTICRLRRSR